MRRFTGMNAALLGGIMSAAAIALPASAMGQLNGLHGTQVLTGADPSTLVTSSTYNGSTGGASINDTAMTGTGADRFDYLLSKDGGATAFTIPAGEGFTISADVKLTGGTITPRKEAGIRINGTGANVGNDALFILDTDAGEIVAFGGPFALFGNNSHQVNNTNGDGNPFVNGDTIFMGETYNAAAGTLQYFAQNITTGGPLFSSGPNLTYTPPGPVQVGFYSQWTPSGPTDSDSAIFTNVSASITVPEPASMSLVAIGLAGLMARRRAKRLA
jgi:hypothetical protein